MKTYVATNENTEHKWYLVDAKNQILGRLATQIANCLSGKRKPEYTPHIDTGDYVVVINSDQIAVTGNKEQQKMYYDHSGYPGGIKEKSLEKMRAKDSRRIIERAVKGMLPKNPLGRAKLSKLKIYAGAEHPHEAQQPQVIHLVDKK